MLRGALYKRSFLSNPRANDVITKYSLQTLHARFHSQGVGEADSPNVIASNRARAKVGDHQSRVQNTSDTFNENRKQESRKRYNSSEMKNKMRELHHMGVSAFSRPVTSTERTLAHSLDKSPQNEIKNKDHITYPLMHESNVYEGQEEWHTLSTEAIEEKYDFLKWKPDKGTYDKVLQQQSGYIRLDSMNKPQGFKNCDFQQHKQLESDESDHSNKLGNGSENTTQYMSEIVGNLTRLEPVLGDQFSETVPQKVVGGRNETAYNTKNQINNPQVKSGDLEKDCNYYKPVKQIETASFKELETLCTTQVDKRGCYLFDQSDQRENTENSKHTVEQAIVGTKLEVEKENEPKGYVEGENNYFDQYYFANLESSVLQNERSVKSNIFDEQYFSEPQELSNDNSVSDMKNVNLVTETIQPPWVEPTEAINEAGNITKFPGEKIVSQDRRQISGIQSSYETDLPEMNEFDKQYFSSAPVEETSTTKTMFPENGKSQENSKEWNNVHDINLQNKLNNSALGSTSNTQSNMDLNESTNSNMDLLTSTQIAGLSLQHETGVMDQRNFRNLSLNEQLSGQHSKGKPFYESEESLQSEVLSETASQRTVVDSRSSDMEKPKKKPAGAHVRNEPAPNLENPQTAYDLVMKMRKEKKAGPSDKTVVPSSMPRLAKWAGEKDSHGFRILTNQTLDMHNQPEHVVVNILKNSIIYENDDLIALDKPYGLPSHGGPGIHHSVGQLLGKLAERIDRSGSLEKLQLIHRLDKETTGVMLLAKSSQAAWKLRDYFKKQEVIKKYWLITKGIPSPQEGVIDIPLAEGTVLGNYRMCLRPNYGPEHKLYIDLPKSGTRFEAVTNYRVLAEEGSAALVECQPETGVYYWGAPAVTCHPKVRGVKHQIRCHMAFALNTPILGDHKYSHFSKLAPQKLHPDILQRLGIRQAKVRHLAMHLHARSLVLPEFDNGQNLFISAKLPGHFVQNMKWLKLKPPKK